MIEITDAALRKAAGEGMDTFIQVFTDRYKEVIGGELTAESMPLLTGEQNCVRLMNLHKAKGDRKSVV